MKMAGWRCRYAVSTFGLIFDQPLEVEVDVPG